MDDEIVEAEIIEYEWTMIHPPSSWKSLAHRSWWVFFHYPEGQKAKLSYINCPQTWEIICAG